jgi:hypothetical protein
MKMSVEHWWYDIYMGKTEVLAEKPVPVPFCPTHISHTE